MLKPYPLHHPFSQKDFSITLYLNIQCLYLYLFWCFLYENIFVIAILFSEKTLKTLHVCYDRTANSISKKECGVQRLIPCFEYLFRSFVLHEKHFCYIPIAFICSIKIGFSSACMHWLTARSFVKLVHFLKAVKCGPDSFT